MDEIIIYKITNLINNKIYGMKIIEIKDNRIFNSISESSKYYNISTSMIRDRIYNRVKDDKFIFMNYEDFIANGIS